MNLPRDPVVRETVLVALALGVVHVLFRLSGAFPFGVYDDDGVYVALGKAIAQGAGYRSIHLIGAPLQLRYPPGLPLLLAIPWAVGGSLTAVRAMVSVLSVLVVTAAGAAIWWIGRRQLGIRPWPLLVCAVSPLALDPAIQFYNLPLSESYFVLGWAVALLLVFPLTAGDGAEAVPRVRAPWRAAAVGLVLAATTLFRAAGVALIPAVLLALWLRQRRTEAAVCAAAAIVPLALWEALRLVWIARGPVSSLPDDLGYWQWIGVQRPWAAVLWVGRDVAANAWNYVGRLGDWILPGGWAGALVVLVALLGAVAGAVRHRRDRAVLGLTVLAAAVLTLAWPFTQGRLILPLLPFAGLLVAGAVDDGTRERSRAVRWGANVVLGCVLLGVTARQVQLRRLADQSFRSGVMPPRRDQSPVLVMAIRSLIIANMSQWVIGHTERDDRIVSQIPAAVYLYTGRQSVAAIPTESPLRPSVFATPGRYLAERILEDHVTVIVWSPNTVGLGRDIAVIEARCPGVLRRDPASSQAPVFYRVHRGDACLQRFVPGGAGDARHG